MAAGTKEDGNPAPKRRLFDIVAEELSPVDFPANQKKFTFVKGRDGMPVKTEKDEQSQAGALVIPMALKKAVLPNLTAGLAKAMAFVKAVQAATESDGFEGLGDLHKSELGVIKSLLVATSKQDVKAAELPALSMTSVVKAALLDLGTQFAEAVAKLTSVVMNADDGEDSEGAKMPDEIAKAIEGLSAFTDSIGKKADELADAEKAKKKPPAPPWMKDEETKKAVEKQMTGFHGKLDILAKMAIESVTTEDFDTSASKELAPVQIANSGQGQGVSVGSLEPSTGVQQKDLQQLAAQGNSRDGYLAKSQELMAQLVSRLDTLTSKIDGVEKLAKSNATQVAAISKSRGVSSQVPVEGGTRRQSAEKVAWPMDMNNDQTDPTKIDKAVSFYE